MKTSAVDIVLDIETVPVPLSNELKEFLLKGYKPPSNYKDPEKIKAHRDEFIRDLDSSGGFKVYNQMPVSVAFASLDSEGELDIESRITDDSEELAQFVHRYLTDAGFYRLVGFNIKGFDIPHLCRLLSQHDLSFPRRLGKWDVVDLCEWPLDRKYKLKEACLAFDIPISGMDGSDVAALWNTGKFREIEEYNREDVKITHQLYTKLSHVYHL